MGAQIFYSVGQYGMPFNHSIDRPRTIAAFYAAQGKPVLYKVPMRRDILNFLMSPRAVGYWLKNRWIEKVGKVGRVELLQLTDSGMSLCGSSHRDPMVSRWLRHMTIAEHAIGEAKVFEPINNT